MRHTLISFLGNPNPTSKDQATKNYKFTDYELDGSVFSTRFLGLGLTEQLKPQKLLLVGTSGSMWDVFFENQAAVHDEHILKLMEAVEQERVDEALLQPCIPKMEQQLGCKVECVIIRYARDEAEQVDLLHRIAEALNEGDEISIDITHSFRHLPMLALVAARFLKNIKNIQTHNIYYGAFGMNQKNAPAPVIDLSGMLKMLDWVDALSAYNHSGNYQVFADLFREEGADKAAECLKDAAFYENTNQIHAARSSLGAFRNMETAGSPLIGLFAQELDKRTEWAERSRYYDHQLQSAQLHLDKANYWRAGILIHEAWISKMVYCYGGLGYLKGEAKEFRLRADAEDLFHKEETDADKKDIFWKLNGIRNALAHGTEAHPTIRKILKNPDALRKELNHALQVVRQWQPEK